MEVRRVDLRESDATDGSPAFHRRNERRAGSIGVVLLVLAGLAGLAGCRGSGNQAEAASRTVASGEGQRHNSAKAEVGRELFFDASLSSSGKLSCASCHSPEHAYGPANGLAVQMGGPELQTPGLRAAPSLRYTLARTPIWSHARPVSIAEQAQEKDNGPSGGFAWDGRFNSLHEQAAFPLLAPSEMAGSKDGLLRTLKSRPYAAEMKQVFGPEVFATSEAAFAAVLEAIERFELEAASFHPFTSKYDAYLDGKVKLTAREARGLALFNDTTRGNCSTCHLSSKGADGSHPLFTDYQFEAIGVPRNKEVAANRDPHFYDLGLCGPVRMDKTENKSYCGMFKTPTLRNVAARQAFFHNGRFHTLKETLEFYVQRDADPAKWYGDAAKAKLPYNDLPMELRGNVDRVTLPLARGRGDGPVWNDAEIEDVIAFLKTLNDADVR
jgi:cytochrome c peroxidase